MIVLDASAAAELILRGAGATAVESRALHLGEDLHAPDVIDLEVVSVLRRCVAGGSFSARDAEAALSTYRMLRIERHPTAPLLGRLWELRSILTPYDAAYVALAEGLAAPLVTFDARLARAHGHAARVEQLTR